MIGDSPASAAPRILARPDGAGLAYHAWPGKAPGVVFLGGFMSDMAGVKATSLEAACRRAGRAFVRFDYFGHGASSGAFTDGTIGRWAEDATAVIDELTEDRQVLVGSSMGGWIMLLAALARRKRVAGLFGIAAAPDFTEALIWPSYNESVRETRRTEGFYLEPSDYGEPYPITYRLITEARNHLVLGLPIALPCPVRLVHGMRDAEVPWRHALTLAEAIAGDDVRVTLLKDGEHRLSEPNQIAYLCAAVLGFCDELEGR
jgi:pimeloyl-ACP methyl ester carboxylesterase